MTPDLTVQDSKTLKSRIFLVSAILFSVGLGWFGVRWQMGDLLAALTPLTDPNAAQIAVFAERLSPANPSTAWLRASAGDASDGAPVSSLDLFERTVRLAPFNHRWRVDLARALEQDGQTRPAESEFKRAVELAPSYAFPRWHLGNFYLRQKRTEEAFSQFKKAAENNRDYREQVYSLAWEYFDKDASQLEKLAGDLPEPRANLAYFFAAHGRAADSLRNWNVLSDRDKASNFSIGKSIALGLYEQKHFAQALEFSKQNGNDTTANAGAVTNAGFEAPMVDTVENAWFNWQISRNEPKFEIAVDSKIKHLGDSSLRVVFKAYAKPALANITQTVVVQSGVRYRLRFFVRTENLKSAGGPLIEIVNANDDRLITQSKNLPTGTSDWQEMSVDFTVPGNCDGIRIRTVRTYCGESCPITGSLWYDDFQIDRL